MKRSLRAAFILTAGTLAALLLLEAALRLSGLYFRHFAGRAGAAGGRTVVLCAGDSFTFGLGAPEGESYPALLQRLLDREHGKGTYSVVNGGALGENSSMLAERLPGLLREHRPHITLILTGSVNYNLRGSSFFLFSPKDVSFRESARLRADALLSRLKLYRFGRLLTRGKAKTPPEGPYKAKPCSPASESALAAHAREFEARNFAAAGDLLEKALAAEDSCAELHFQRGRLFFYHRRFRPAFMHFRRGRDLDPRHPYVDVFMPQELTLLRPAYTEKILDEVLEYDLKRLCRAAHDAGSFPVIMTYPFTDAKRNHIRSAAAERAGAAFLDLNAVFIPLLDAGKESGYLSGDEPDLLASHPNSRGYELMAGTIARTLASLRSEDNSQEGR